MANQPSAGRALDRQGTTRRALLDAALEVYSTHGFRGATTRLIAATAGVNEVTLFRQFGSKHALLNAAMIDLARLPAPRLPAYPRNPEEELLAWSEGQLAVFERNAAAFRACMSEPADSPELSSLAFAGPQRAFLDLSQYLTRIREAGLSFPSFDERAAASTLLGALLSDAIAREMMPEVFPPANKAAEAYVALLLRAIGADEDSRLGMSDATGAPGG